MTTLTDSTRSDDLTPSPPPLADRRGERHRISSHVIYRSRERELPALAALRRRLAAWYIGTFAIILLTLASLLFWVMARQLSHDLQTSLRNATRQIAHATDIREQELAAGGSAADAIEEIRIPDRELYLFDTTGRIVTPRRAIPVVLRQIVLTSVRQGPVETEIKRGPDKTLVVYAEPIISAGGHAYVAVAVANRIELEQRYSTLIITFFALSTIALFCVAIGGGWLARKATAPVGRRIQYTRRFMAEAAHELRTPIAILRSRAEVTLQRERSAEAYASALSLISKEAEYLGRVIEDLLLLARADIGERPLRRDRVAVDDIMLDAVTAAGALAASRGVRLEIHLAEHSPINADAALIRQLVMIMLDNAIKFTSSGGSVTVQVVRQHDQTMLSIRDTGAGIAAEELPRVFERFYRSDSARSTAPGSGLGLSIARWIADAHGADISIESTLGMGTTVTVTFPLTGTPLTDGDLP